MKKKDLSEERALFSQALREGLARKFEAELAQCPEPIQCSEEHLRKMNEIIEGHARAVRLARLKRRIVAAMVAAALLVLTACTVYAYRGEIKEMLVQIYEAYINLFYDESGSEGDDEIAMHYILGYVPEGYELVEERQEASVGKQKWVHPNGDYIILQQFVWDGTVYSIDSEMGEMSITTFGSVEVYYRATQLHTYIWNDGTYSFMLSTSSLLTNDEIGLIINSLTIEQ